MKHSSERILTTHCGSLARPADLLDMMKARAAGETRDDAAWAARVRAAVAESVRQQANNGIDVVADGEQGKRGFFAYVSERLDGFEPRPGRRPLGFEAEINDFPEYYEQYFRVAMTGGSVAPMVQFVCTGPIAYRGEDAIRRDLDNFRAALGGLNVEEAFMPAVAPSGLGQRTNEYYASDEEYLFALAEALHAEYQAIVDAGFLLQVDDPFLTDVYSYAPQDDVTKKRTAALYVDAVNHALRGIPPERVRFHTCYGINEGPRVHDAPLGELVGEMLRVNAQAYSFEAANPRHEHEYHLWENVKLPEGKILIPGVITHASNIVEHPELIAERLVRHAKLVGRENVIAGADCGFSSQATYTPEVHPTVVWAKFRAMAEGARLATEQLWR
jgi:5-methyltetrahydropteroyltriglutamate--homocysteine methyltransferase